MFNARKNKQSQQVATQKKHSDRNDGMAVKQQQRLEQSYNRIMFSEKSATQPYDVCLEPLLAALNWSGDKRQLHEALPHAMGIEDISMFRNVLLNLGFETEVHKSGAANLSAKDMPCVLEFSSGPFICFAINDNGSVQGFDAEGRNSLSPSEMKSVKSIVRIKTEDSKKVDTGARNSWFYNQMWQMRKSVAALCTLTLLINVLTLSTPLYTMSVYNYVVNTGKLDTLGFFFLGILFVIGAEIYTRRMRAKVLAYMGARLDSAINIKAFDRVLNMPLHMTETASVHRQLTQFRQFTQIREFLSSNLSAAYLDLPYILMFMAVIGVLGGMIAVIPVILLVVLCVISMIVRPMANRKSIESGIQSESYTSLSTELCDKLPTIRHTNVEDFWTDRQGKVAARSAKASFHSRFAEATLQHLSQGLVMIAGVVTIAYGAHMVIEGEMSHGGLIAVMMIIWRVLSPVQLTILSFHRVQQVRRAIGQLNSLMKMPIELRLKNNVHSLRKFEGDLSFDNVSFRHRGQNTLSVRGVNLEIKKGEVVAIVGPSESGKSTLLKLCLGLYRPISGYVALDGCNLTQLDTAEVRYAVSYLTPRPMAIYGTVAQNVRAANPLASDAEVLEALHAAGIDEDDPLMADGIDTRIRNEDMGLTDTDRGRLAMATAFGANSPVLLLDEPGTYLNEKSERAMLNTIAKMRGEKTVLIVTSRKSHLKVCDRIIVMQQGAVAGEATPQEYFSQLESKS